MHSEQPDRAVWRIGVEGEGWGETERIREGWGEKETLGGEGTE